MIKDSIKLLKKYNSDCNCENDNNCKIVKKYNNKNKTQSKKTSKKKWFYIRIYIQTTTEHLQILLY